VRVFFLIVALTLAGCANQLNLRAGEDASITLVEVDAEAAGPMGLGGQVEADGCVLVLRGVDLETTPISDIKMTTPDCSFGREIE